MNRYNITTKFKYLIQKRESQSSKEDKAWVSRLVWDLRRHYLSVSKNKNTFRPKDRLFLQKYAQLLKE